MFTSYCTWLQSNRRWSNLCKYTKAQQARQAPFFYPSKRLEIAGRCKPGMRTTTREFISSETIIPSPTPTHNPLWLVLSNRTYPVFGFKGRRVWSARRRDGQPSVHLRVKDRSALRAPARLPPAGAADGAALGAHGSHRGHGVRVPVQGQLQH